MITTKEILVALLFIFVIIYGVITLYKWTTWPAKRWLKKFAGINNKELSTVPDSFLYEIRSWLNSNDRSPFPYSVARQDTSIVFISGKVVINEEADYAR